MNAVKYITNSAGAQEAVPLNRGELTELRSLWNAAGDIDTASAAYKYTIDTLTSLSVGTVEQKFYEVTPSEYLPIRVNAMGWNDTVNQKIEFIGGAPFESWSTGVGNGESRSPSVEAGLSNKSYTADMVSANVTWNRNEIEQAAITNDWDPVASKIRALKKAYDLGFQERAFLGSIQNPTAYKGLIVNSEITVNTSLITVPISTMTYSQLDTLIAGLISAYFTQTNSTAMPDTFLLPYTDFLGLQTAYPSAAGVVYPVPRIEYLTRALKAATQNPNFEIKPLAYCDATRNTIAGLNKQVYMLYKRNDASTLRIDVGVPLYTGPVSTADGFVFTTRAVSKFTGVQIYRPLELLKFQY